MMEDFSTLPPVILSALATAVAVILATLWLCCRPTARREEKKPPEPKTYFRRYLDRSEVQDALQSGCLGRGILSIPKTGRDRAWVRGVPGLQEDVYLNGDQALNRAFDGDEVFIDLETREVVGIEQRHHRLEVVGILRCTNSQKASTSEPNKGGKSKGKGKDKNASRNRRDAADVVELQFLPNDSRVPILVLSSSVVRQSSEALAICTSLAKAYDPNFGKISAQRQTALLEMISAFSDSDDSLFHFDTSLSAYERKFVHCFAQQSGLESNSQGEGTHRHLVISKSDSSVLAQEKKEDVPIHAQLFVAAIDFEWKAHCRRPRASSLRFLGLCGDPETHLRGILVEHAICTSEPPKEVLHYCEKLTARTEESRIQEEKRRDFRQIAVFSIDPKGARDLDDALHAVPAEEEGVMEIGIHIADVAVFVPEGGALDSYAQQRGTTTYFPSSNYPMLPRKLSENSCSLHGGQDRLAFSLLVRMSLDGLVIGEPWFGRSIICSRGKLSYEEAQMILLQEGSSNAVDMCRSANELAMKQDAASVVDGLQRLAHIARALQARSSKRGGGARMRPSFHINAETGIVSLDEDDVEEREDEETRFCDTHNLVEEFMLLANRMVAERLAKAVPNHAVLRSQAPPRTDRVRAWSAQCAQHASDVTEIEWQDLQPHQVGDAQASLMQAAQKLAVSDPARAAGLRALAIQASRTMNAAQYVCGLSLECGHWSLGLSYYTHFTSPIRRYADLLVHRELAKVLGNAGVEDIVNVVDERIAHIVARINRLAQHSKWAQQEAEEMLMARWLEQQGPKNFSAVVVGMSKAYATVLVAKLGLEVQCWFKDAIGCKRYESVLEEEGTGRYSEVRLFDDEQDGSEVSKCVLTLRELDVCVVKLQGGLHRRVFIKAALQPCIDGTQTEGASLKSPIADDVPSPNDLARSASDELNRTLSRMSSSGED